MAKLPPSANSPQTFDIRKALIKLLCPRSMSIIPHSEAARLRPGTLRSLRFLAHMAGFRVILRRFRPEGGDSGSNIHSRAVNYTPPITKQCVVVRSSSIRLSMISDGFFAI